MRVKILSQKSLNLYFRKLFLKKISFILHFTFAKKKRSRMSIRNEKFSLKKMENFPNKKKLNLNFLDSPATSITRAFCILIVTFLIVIWLDDKSLSTLLKAMHTRLFFILFIFNCTLRVKKRWEISRRKKKMRVCLAGSTRDKLNNCQLFLMTTNNISERERKS